MAAKHDNQNGNGDAAASVVSTAALASATVARSGQRRPCESPRLTSPAAGRVDAGTSRARETRSVRLSRIWRGRGCPRSIRPGSIRRGGCSGSIRRGGCSGSIRGRLIRRCIGRGEVVGHDVGTCTRGSRPDGDRGGLSALFVHEPPAPQRGRRGGDEQYGYRHAEHDHQAVVERLRYQLREERLTRQPRNVRGRQVAEDPGGRQQFMHRVEPEERGEQAANRWQRADLVGDRVRYALGGQALRERRRQRGREARDHQREKHAN